MSVYHYSSGYHRSSIAVCRWTNFWPRFIHGSEFSNSIATTCRRGKDRNLYHSSAFVWSVRHVWQVKSWRWNKCIQDKPKVSKLFFFYLTGNIYIRTLEHQSCRWTKVIFSLRSILLLAEGRTAYMGSRSDAIQYFDRSVCLSLVSSV